MTALRVNMFDFSKIHMQPHFGADFKKPSTELQISDLEAYFGHLLPDNLKFIFKNFNGGSPICNNFDVKDSETGIPLQWKLSKFYTLDEHKELPSNIWWIIKKFSPHIGTAAIPFAEDDLQQIYYLKWVNNMAQVWFLSTLDRSLPEAIFLKPSFDELLASLYD